jgi:putative aldouronate transport system permease protein
MLMAVPGVLQVFIFAYLPMFGVVIAFKNYRAADGILGSAWVGLENFRFLFGSSTSWRAVYNTLAMNALFIIVGTFGALAVALLLNEIHQRNPWLLKFAQSSLLLPYVISWIIVRSFVFALLNSNNGWINTLLTGMGFEPVRWFAEPQLWPVILVLVNLWKNVGFGALIYLAGMLAISPEYYEAAKIDGASKRQQIWYVTLPLLLPLVFVNVLLAIGNIFRADFGLFFQVTQNTPALYETTDVLDTFVYRSLLTTGDVGMASAAGFLQSIVGLATVLCANWMVRRLSDDKALF